MSNNNKKPNAYHIGYGKPPRATQFKKGQSGNLAGRRKGSRSLEALFKSTLDEKVTVTESGERKTITKLQATIKQVVNRAASGDPRATQLLLGVAKLIDGQEDSPPRSTALDDDDQKVVAGVVARIRRGGAGGEGGSNVH